MILDHVQLAMPPGAEDKARVFFVEVLGMTEIEKPEPLRARGGCWFRKDSVHLHLGVEEAFRPQKKAHPAFVVDDIDVTAETLLNHGAPVKWDNSLPNVTRLYTEDPFGNRIEIMKAGHGFSQ